MRALLEEVCPYSRLGWQLQHAASLRSQGLTGERLRKHKAGAAGQQGMHACTATAAGEPVQEGVPPQQLGTLLPAVLVTSAVDDARVPVWVAAKWAARARRLQVRVPVCGWLGTCIPPRAYLIR